MTTLDEAKKLSEEIGDIEKAKARMSRLQFDLLLAMQRAAHAAEAGDVPEIAKGLRETAGALRLMADEMDKEADAVEKELEREGG